MNAFLKICLLMMLLWGPEILHAQGCSDAGACTMSEFKPGASADTAGTHTNRLSAGISYGTADHAITVAGAFVAYTRKIGRQFDIDLKFTVLSQNGNGISTFGPGDIFLSSNYKPGRFFHFSLGVKIPLADGNKTLDGLPLPMDYQSSLGTFDLIAGVGFEWKNLMLVAGYQQPLTQNNNAFISSVYPDDSPLSGFQTTNRFRRSADVLLRVAYTFGIGKKFDITPGLLPIYHLTDDRYADPEGIVQDIAGSQGITLNANLFLGFRFNAQNSIQLSAGLPLIIREARPDGLTRHFIAAIEYAYTF